AIRKESEPPREIDWQAQEMTAESLRQSLRTNKEKSIKVTRVINSRVEKEVRFEQELRRANGDERADELWKRVSHGELKGEAPRRMIEMGEAEGYKARVNWGAMPDEMDVEYTRGEAKWEQARGGRRAEKTGAVLTGAQYANEPMKGAKKR